MLRPEHLFLHRQTAPVERLRLRIIALIAGFALPLVLTLVALFTAGGSGVVASAIAVTSAAVGLVAERWLFFAEAKHTVILYYGAAAV